MNYRMADKGIQVAIGLKRPQLSNQATQTPSTKTKENGTQCGHGRGSYMCKREHRQWRYDDLVLNDRQRSFNGVADSGRLTCKVRTVSSMQQRCEISDMQ